MLLLNTSAATSLHANDCMNITAANTVAGRGLETYGERKLIGVTRRGAFNCRESGM